MIQAIIVDDEPYCCDTLETMLEKYCPDVQLVAVCHSGEEAIAAISQQKPDLVFLDIEMPRMNGFDMLQKINPINFEIIFTTSFDQYALRAIRFSALDYLLKPIDKDDLANAVQKEILKQMRDGNHLKLIAQTSDTSYETVRTHVKHIYKKLGVMSASEAVIKAMKMEL